MVKPTGPVPAPEGQPTPPAKPALRVALSKALTLQLQAFRKRHGRDGYMPADLGVPVTMPEDLPDATLAQAQARLERFDQAVLAAHKRLEAADQKLAQSEAKLAATRTEIATVQKERMALGERIATVQKQIADIDNRSFQLAEKKADLLIRIADHEAKLGAAPEAEFQVQAKDLKALEQELAAVRSEQRDLRVQRRSLVKDLGHSVSDFAAGTMAGIESLSKSAGKWLLDHAGPLRKPLEAAGKWIPLRKGFELVGNAWNRLEAFFGRHGHVAAAAGDAISDRERLLVEKLADAAAKALGARKADLAAGRAKALSEDRDLAKIEIQEIALAKEKTGLVERLSHFQAEDRGLAEKSRALGTREAEELRQVEADRQVRDQAQHQYEEAQSRKRAEEKRYWELYDQRKRDEQRHAEQYSEKQHEAARLDASKTEAQRLAQVYQEARRDGAKADAASLEARRQGLLADQVRQLTSHAAEAAAAGVEPVVASSSAPPVDEGVVNRARENKHRIKDAAKLREEAAPKVARQLDAVANLAEDKVASLPAGQEKFSVADAGTVARRRYRRDLLGT